MADDSHTADINMTTAPDSPKNTLQPSASNEPPPPPPPPPSPPPTDPLLYGGYTRFELELEFVTLLASPLYLNHLAALKLLHHPPFLAYLAYLRYWTRPDYVRYLEYPGPTLRALELLQEERFRLEVLSPELVGRLIREGVEGVAGGGVGGG